MSQPSFDVLRQPWIPVIRMDGTREEVGILSALEHAHELRAIHDPSPIIEFGLYRLLVAFLLDALMLAGRQPADIPDLESLIREKCIDLHIIDDYVCHCGDVFNLFNPERPFLQTANLAGDEGGPIEALFFSVPSGSEAIHWHHVKEGKMSVSAADAVRALTAFGPFMKQGGRGYSPSINGSSPLYAMPIGGSLFHTLILNLPIRAYGEGKASAAWLRRDTPIGRRSPMSTTDALTWQPRQATLLTCGNEQDGAAAASLRFKPGLQVDGSDWIDPNLAYKWGDKGAEKVSMQKNRALWRDAGALALLTGRELGGGNDKVSIRRPDVVEQAYSLIHRDESLHLRVYGLRAKQANVFEWISSDLQIPAVIGKTTRLGDRVEQELQIAESSARALRSAILRLTPEFEREEQKSPGKRKAWDKRSIRSIADRCERTYWQRLESHFLPLMNAFASLDPNAPDDPERIASTAKDWRGAVRTLAVEEFESAAKDMDADSDALERQVNARSRLNSTLRKVLS